MKKFLWNIALECVRRDSVIAHSRLWPSFTSLPYGESVNSPEGDTFSSIAKFLTAPCFSLSFLTATMAFSLQKSPPPQKNTGIFSHDRQSDFVWVFRKLAHTMYIQSQKKRRMYPVPKELLLRGIYKAARRQLSRWNIWFGGYKVVRRSDKWRWQKNQWFFHRQANACSDTEPKGI